MDTSYKFLTDAWATVIHSPPWFAIGICLMIVGFLAQKSARIDNRWIPIIYIVLALVLYPLLGDRKAIPADQQNPMLLMCLLGVILGFFSYLTHFVAYRVAQKYLPEGFFPDEESKTTTSNNNQTNSNGSNHT
jgi:uncharacterized membrane protein